MMSKTLDLDYYYFKKTQSIYFKTRTLSTKQKLYKLTNVLKNIAIFSQSISSNTVFQRY